MRDSTTIFDQESDAAAEEAADLTTEFWGDTAGWARAARSAGGDRTHALQVKPSDGSDRSFRLDQTPASMRAIRDGFAAFRPKKVQRDTSSVERTREHGIVRPSAAAVAAADAGRSSSSRRPAPERLAHRDASIGDLAAGRYDGAPYPRSGGAEQPVTDARTDDDLIELTPSAPPGVLGAVDPRIVRFTLLALAVVLAIPLALALRGGDAPTVQTDPDASVPAAGLTDGTGGADGAVAPDGPGAAGSQAAPMDGGTDGAGATAPAPDGTRSGDGTNSDAADATAVDATSATADAPAAASVGAGREAADSTVSDPSASSDDSSVQQVATVDETAADDVPDCSRTYTAGAGDSWYRIADEAGVTPAQLLAQNQATLDTVIFPSTEICLPAGAAMPSPPTTAAPTTAASADAAAPTSTDEPTTTAAPTTTQAPTTTAAPTTTVPASVSAAEVRSIIRETWPDDQHEKALEIAWRESNYQPHADNGWCCVGVFQLYWTVHQGWLDDYGIHTRNDLKDARKNIAAAYALYERSGGWGPWGG